MSRRQEGDPLTHLVVRIIINTGALAIAAGVINYAEVGDFTLTEGHITIVSWESGLATAVVFGLVNALIRPIVMVTTCLLQVLTLGLFTLVVNALMLLLTSWLAEVFTIGFHVNGFGAAFFGAILISLVSTMLNRLLR